MSEIVQFREYRDPTRTKTLLMPQVPQRGDLIVEGGESWVVEGIEYEFDAQKDVEQGIRAVCRAKDDSTLELRSH